MTNELEIWCDVMGYKDYYSVSSFGRVKSIKRKDYMKRNDCIRTRKERILKQSIDSRGYFIVSLSVRNIKATRTVHQLVAESFLGFKRCGMKLVINHKNFNKLDNNLDNIEVVTSRQNGNKKHLNHSSKFTGVSWRKSISKWGAYIFINKKLIHLGFFKVEEEASKAYQVALRNHLEVESWPAEKRMEFYKTKINKL